MELVAPKRIDAGQRMLRFSMISAFVLALAAILTAPFLALTWSHQPFPGFLIDQTLIVEPITGSDWTGTAAGIQYPQHVVRMGGRPVGTSPEFRLALDGYQIGDRITVFTRSRAGVDQLFPGIVLTEFSNSDLFRMFWLPYLIGVVYLGIGAWIYWLRGYTRPGRSLAIFCIVAGLTCSLMFDTFTTHAMTTVWIVAVAQIGGVLISLAWRFPEEWGPVTRRSWILMLPVTISLGLAAWALAVGTDQSDPWAYIPARQTSFRYAALGILIFLIVMIYRARKGTSAVVRRQARFVLVGSVIAFSPIMIWLVAPLFGFTPVFDPAVFIPSLLIFPISVGLAIMRYRLWEVDTLVNRAFVYGLLTAILAGVFAAMIAFTQRLFLAVTGEQSDIAVVVTTLIVAATFTPVKSAVEGFVDRQFHDTRDETRTLRAYGDQIRDYVQMTDATRLAEKLLAEAVHALKAESGAVSLVKDGQLEVVHTTGPWRGDAHLSVTLNCGVHRHGLLQLGPHLPRQPYERREVDTLQAVADQVARAICKATES